MDLKQIVPMMVIRQYIRFNKKEIMDVVNFIKSYLWILKCQEKMDFKHL